MTNEKATHQNFRFFKTCFCLLILLFLGNFAPASAQNPQTNYFAPQPPNNNYMKNSAAFRQEIMRMEISVRRGKQTLPITQVPRVGKNDVITLRLSDEAVGGIKPHQSLWDWTFLVAFINPNRRATVKVDGQWQSAVSQEVQFRKTGWYREYTFTVPYDSQPIFFLYPQSKNRDKILKLIDKNYNEVRKLGEKTIEIAGAYAQISSFLNELQSVLYMSQYSRYANNGIYGGYGGYSSYNPYGGGYNSYNPYGNQQQNQGVPFNYNVFVEQSIERLAKGFNVALPGCWQNNGTPYSGYGSTGGSQYGSTYGGYGSYGGYGANQNNYGYAVNQDLINRAQCVAKNIRLEDFDFSVSRLLQQGGVLAAAQLREKYPQLAYWISIAAVAIDFIVKIFQKSPLRIVPTMVQSSDGFGFGSNALGASGGNITWGNGVNYGGYNQNNYSSGYPPANNQNAPNQAGKAAVKLSLYAENQPDDMQFITAYPVVTHKWQAEPDPEVISLYPPVLAEPCLHVGMNLLKNTDLGQSWAEDVYARDFRLVMSDKNGFRKEFPLRKNLGLAGWELNLTQEDLNQIPKISMNLEAEVIGFRGFNEVRSPKFDLPLSTGSNWEITRETQQNFAVGGRRIVTIRNTLGSCLCLQRVIYKPASGGQFVFEVDSKEAGLQFSPDGRAASFVIDTTNFPPGMGTLEIKTYGSESQPQQQTQMQPGGMAATTTPNPAATDSSATVLNLNLHPLPPHVTGVRVSKGDRQALITGERLEQIRAVKINGKRAVAVGNYNQPGQMKTENNGSGTQTWGGTAKQSENPAPQVSQSMYQTGRISYRRSNFPTSRKMSR